MYTDEEFVSKLKNIDLSNLENYREHIKALIKNALKEKTVEKTTKEKTTKEFKSIETVVTEVKEEKVEKPVSRKRNYKVEVE